MLLVLFHDLVPPCTSLVPPCICNIATSVCDWWMCTSALACQTNTSHTCMLLLRQVAWVAKAQKQSLAMLQALNVGVPSSFEWRLCLPALVTSIILKWRIATSTSESNWAKHLSMLLDTYIDVAHSGIPYLHNIKHKWWCRRSIVSLTCPVRLLPQEPLPFWLALHASAFLDLIVSLVLHDFLKRYM